MAWRWAAATRIGTSHLRLGTCRQDVLRCFSAGRKRDAFCALVCDGAGSAKFGEKGAALIARIFTVGLREHFRSSPHIPNDEQLWAWIDEARDVIAAAAEARACSKRDFASTLVLLVSSQAATVVVHVGDGGVVIRSGSQGWQSLSWPENGEYASTTYFVTDDPSPRVRITRCSTNFDAVAVFSDGVESLALDLVGEVPHVPFFQGMIAPLDRESGTGKNQRLSDALGDFLQSSRVCERTDDDKTLIVASAA